MAVSNKEALAELSHEICNHLTQIMLASNLLQLDLQELLTREQQHQFKGIDEGAQHIRRLLARLKRVADTGSGMLRTEQNISTVEHKII